MFMLYWVQWKEGLSKMFKLIDLGSRIAEYTQREEYLNRWGANKEVFTEGYFIMEGYTVIGTAPNRTVAEEKIAQLFFDQPLTIAKRVGLLTNELQAEGTVASLDQRQNTINPFIRHDQRQ